MKSLLIGMLFASPAGIYWMDLDVSGTVSPSAPASHAAGSVVTIPVEVIATGSAPQWIHVLVEQ